MNSATHTAAMAIDPIVLAQMEPYWANDNTELSFEDWLIKHAHAYADHSGGQKPADQPALFTVWMWARYGKPLGMPLPEAPHCRELN